MPRPLRSLFRALMAALFVAAGASATAQDWRTASREPVGLAPDPHVVKEAIVQVYGARTVGAKGWFGAEPELYAEKRGAGVDELIKRIDKAAREYPCAKEYTVWPGPNSNTFAA